METDDPKASETPAETTAPEAAQEPSSEHKDSAMDVDDGPSAKSEEPEKKVEPVVQADDDDAVEY